jgi:serine protease
LILIESMYRYLPFLILLFFEFQVYGQSPNQQMARKKRTSQSYLEKTILFEVRADYNLDFKTQKENTPAFKKLFKELGIKSIERRFPNHDAPKEKRNKLGQKLTDLSGIYFLTYSVNMGIEDVILKMEKTGLFVYAEPWFKESLLYIPNDSGIQPTAPYEMNQFYLERMQAYEAWDITKGDTNIVIGIVDTGVKLDHEDLQGNIKYNYNDPIDGIDNDGDGYIDNFRGWDLGDHDNDPSANGYPHGVNVSGIASATTDNVLGIAGAGFKCKFMPVKAAADAQTNSIAYGYDGILYAADHGCDVINLSWGGPGSFSATGQAVINYAAINHNVVVVAAAGNSGKDEDYYPAAFDNVMSVAGVDTIYSPSAGKVIDMKWGYPGGSTYGHSVDICAQSTRVYSTLWSGGYDIGGGTSFAAPLVAGAAGLVKSKFPSYTARQILERLRVTADIIDSFSENFPYREKLGKGRMNIYRAVSDSTSPSVRMYADSESAKYGASLFSGDTVSVKCKFRNFLAPTTNVVVTMTTSSPYITMLDSTTSLGAIATLDSAQNYADPFTFYIHPDAPLDLVVSFRLGFQDGIYNDYQYFDIYMNPAYLTIDTNQVAMTVASDGRLGYTSTGLGEGFLYKNQSPLYEAGLMIGQKSGKVSDCVRNYGSQDFDFTTIKSINFVAPQYSSQEEAQTIFTDTSISQKIGVKVDQKSYAWGSAPNDKYIIVEYNIKNISGAAFDTLYAGIFADWDIGAAYDNRADYDPSTKLGYIYETTPSGLFAGIALMTNDVPSCYSMDNSNVGGNNINPNGYPGFTTSKKLATLDSKIGRPQAGMFGSGNDVSHVIGAELYNIQANETRTVAFAILAGDNATDIKASAAAAYNKYKFYKTSSLPTVSNQHICQKTPVNVTITPGNGTKFKFYKKLPALTPVFVGSSYTMTNVSQTDTIYVTGADSVFESNPVPVNITFSNLLKADFAFDPDSLFLSQSHSVFFVDKSQNASSILWNLGDGSNSVSKNFVHHYNAAGNYNIQLTASDAFGCKDSLTGILRVFPASYRTSPLPVISNLHLCGNDSANVTLTPANGTRFKFYSALPADTPLFAGSSYTINNLSQADTMYVTGADSVFESNPVTVYITFTAVHADFVFNPDSLNLSNGNSVFFVNQSQNASSILWDLGDGTGSGSGSVLHSYNSPGNYNIKLKATDTFGCTDSLTKVLKVYSAVTGLNTPLENGIGIYPNPVGNQLNVQMEFNQQQPVSFSIMDLLGKEIARVSNADIQSKIFQLDFSAVPQGIYIIKFDVGGKTYLRKFIRE